MFRGKVRVGLLLFFVLKVHTLIQKQRVCCMPEKLVWCQKYDEFDIVDTKNGLMSSNLMLIVFIILT